MIETSGVKNVSRLSSENDKETIILIKRFSKLMANRDIRLSYDGMVKYYTDLWINGSSDYQERFGDVCICEDCENYRFATLEISKEITVWGKRPPKLMFSYVHHKTGYVCQTCLQARYDLIKLQKRPRISSSAKDFFKTLAMAEAIKNAT